MSKPVVGIIGNVHVVENRFPAQMVGERNLRALGPMYLGVGIDGADTALHIAQFVRRNEIGFVDQDHIGEGDLVLHLRRVFEPIAQPFGVGDGHDRVQPGFPPDILVDEKGLCHRRRVGEAGRLDDHRVELALAAHQAVEDADQVAPHRAADAAVIHFEHFLVGADHEVIVDADFAELVDDDGVFLAVRLGKNAIEQCGLAGAEIAGEHRNRHFF